MNRGSMAGVLLVALGAGSAQAADDIDNISALAQNQFRALSEDLGAATSYKALTPAEPLGVTGIDVGIEVTDTSLENTAAFNSACSGCDLDHLMIPKLHLHKGLPMGFDVGLAYTSTSNTNITITGIELRYANMEGGVAQPAVATRFTWSMLDGVDELDMTVMGVELTISKGFAMFTPYIGVGNNWVTSEPAASTGLADEEFTQTKFYVGMNMNFGLANVDFEVDKTGDAQTIGAKLGFRF